MERSNKLNEYRIGCHYSTSSISIQHVCLLQLHYNQLKEELSKLKPPPDLDLEDPEADAEVKSTQDEIQTDKQ